MKNHRPLDGISNYIVPSLPARTQLFVVAIDLIPILIGRLEKARQANIWSLGENEVIGDNLLGEQIMALLQPITTMDNIYRWLETNMRGTVYTYETIAGVNVISPAIPIVPQTTDAPLLPVVARMGEVSNWLVASGNGTTPLVPSMTLASRVQAIIDAIQAAGTDNADIISELQAIALLLV